jgi:hypothetical protein
MKIATKTTTRSFLPLESSETSSRGPGCLNMDINMTKNAIGQLTTAKKTIERTVKTALAFSPKRDLATWPPSSMVAGIKLSIVINKPTHPAKATGCSLITNMWFGPGLSGIGPCGVMKRRAILKKSSAGRVGSSGGIQS